jgi:hypothetical protein
MPLVVGMDSDVESNLYDTHIPQGPCFSREVNCA